MNKIAILGFGQEGRALLRFLRKSPIYKNTEIWILDRNINIRRLDLPKSTCSILGGRTSLKFQTGKNYLKNLDQFDIIFRSPGIPFNLPQIQKAIKKGVKFSSATDLFFSALGGSSSGEKNARPKQKVIGITGTKGKGTTSTLLYRILKNCGFDVHLVGNIGKPAIEILPNLERDSIVVYELSSFQLQNLQKSPTIAAVLDVFPDHLDAHKDLREYLNAKSNIAKWQKSTDKIFYFADNQYSRWIANKSHGEKIPVSPHYSHEFADSHRALKIPGFHNFKNAAMAAAIASFLNCPKDKIIKTIKNFRGLEHRLELVRIIRETAQKSPRESVSSLRKSVIYWYNDSASTNPQTTIAAIKSFGSPIILIAGGRDKNLNYTPLAKAIKKSSVKSIILFGENKKKIKRQIAKSKTPIVLEKDLKSAVKLAYKTAKKLVNRSTSQPITILFSPGSASFDTFKNYKDRGKQFKEIVKFLKV